MKNDLAQNNQNSSQSMACFSSLLAIASVFLFAHNAVSAAPSADDFVGNWTGIGSLMFGGNYEVKMTLKADKACVLEYSDSEPPNTLNPEN